MHASDCNNPQCLVRIQDWSDHTKWPWQSRLGLAIWPHVYQKCRGGKERFGFPSSERLNKLSSLICAQVSSARLRPRFGACTQDDRIARNDHGSGGSGPAIYMAPCLSEMQRVEGKFSGFQAQKGWTNILRWSALRFLRHDIAQTDKQTNKQTRWCLRLWNPKLGGHDETRWPRACSWPDTTQSSNLGFPMLHLSFIFFCLTPHNLVI